MKTPTLAPVISLLSLGVEIASISAALASTAWPSANRALFVPLYIAEPSTVVKMWWLNGAAVSGNVDAGIYRASTLAKVVSSGSVAQTGTSAIQEADITDTLLTPGAYYLAIVLDNATGTLIRTLNDVRHVRAFGCVQMSSAFSLPATAVPETAASTFIPLFGASLRTLVA